MVDDFKVTGAVPVWFSAAQPNRQLSILESQVKYRCRKW
jgi:hypothetical protein